MTTTRVSTARGSPRTFRHEALLYAGREEFVDRASSFLRDAIDAGEATLVIVDQEKVGLLGSALGADAKRVLFADMAEVGKNPARIIPVWRDFVAEFGSTNRRVRGIGEPVWAGRSPDELVECARHESLLNVAFDPVQAWWLLCPYDVSALASIVIEEAQRNHPFITEHGMPRPSPLYAGDVEAREPFREPLPEPIGRPEVMRFGVRDLAAVRAFVARHARARGLRGDRTEDLVSAVNELTTNSARHGGGEGILRLWGEGRSLVCEVADMGHIDDPLVGRVRPSVGRDAGYGLWLVNQLCDLVQVRSLPSGSVVRLRMSAG